MEKIKEFDAVAGLPTWELRAKSYEFIAHQYRDSYHTWRAVAFTLISILSFLLSAILTILILAKI